jgi:hypothetical protein
MIGNIHLTNRRMVFNAVFPPSDLIHSKTSSGGPVIVKSGPVSSCSYHYPFSVQGRFVLR